MSNISFDISAITTTKGKGKALKADSNGIFKDLPLLVIGKVSRNGKDYEVESMVEALSSPSSTFCKKLKAGQLEGEWCHPLIFKDEEMARIMTIDRTRVSHTILRVYTGKTTEKGHTIVYGDVKPFGPCGTYLKEALESPVLNPAFSLRSLVAKTGEDGFVIKQKATALITIDAVDCPGYAEASKVYDPACEGYSVPIEHPEQHVSEITEIIGQESLNDNELLDLLGVDNVEICGKIHGYVDEGGKVLRDARGHAHDIFHSLFK